MLTLNLHIAKEAIDINGVIIENKQYQINITLQEKFSSVRLGYLFHSNDSLKLSLIKLRKLVYL